MAHIPGQKGLLECALCRWHTFFVVSSRPYDTTSISVLLKHIAQLYFSNVFLNVEYAAMYCWLSSGASDTSRSGRGMSQAEARKEEWIDQTECQKSEDHLGIKTISYKRSPPSFYQSY